MGIRLDDARRIPAQVVTRLLTVGTLTRPDVRMWRVGRAPVQAAPLDPDDIPIEEDMGPDEDADEPVWGPPVNNLGRPF